VRTGSKKTACVIGQTSSEGASNRVASCSSLRGSRFEFIEPPRGGSDLKAEGMGNSGFMSYQVNMMYAARFR
jgi:hypothetical protein